MRVMIDAGHGGTDAGAINSTVKEKNINLLVANELQNLLLKKGFQVAMTRNLDVNPTLEERCIIANLWKADIFISIHHNASSVGADGYEVIHSVNGGKGKVLAELVGQEFDKLGQNKRSIYSRANTNGKDYYAVIRNTSMPSIITEFAFLDSKDFEAIDTITEQLAEAKAIYNAVCRFAGVDITEPVAKKSQLQLDVETIQNSIPLTSDYWLKNAVAGGTVRGDYAGFLLHNVAEYLRKKV